jgi:glucokinase
LQFVVRRSSFVVRRSQFFIFMMSYILGLDFGGTKLAAGLVDPVSGTVVADARCPTPPGGAEASLAMMITMARDLLDPKHVSGPDSKDSADANMQPSLTRSLAHPFTLSGIGVSFGGPVEADGRTVRLSMHVPGWEAAPLAERLEATFAAPVVVANDADAAALAEYRYGAGRGVRHMLYLTVSTGIGGGVIIDGRLHRGERAWAGEVGHMVLDPNGPACPCGRNGCLEALASGLSIARAMRERLGAAAQKMTARDVALAVAAGDAVARDVWNSAMNWLGVGIASAANLLNPGCVVIGGGLTRAGELLFAPVRQIVAQRALDQRLVVLPAALGDDVGIIGGAALISNL